MSELLPERVLGFDYGARRIGVASGQRITGTAQALSVIERAAGEPDWAAIARLVREWQPQALVVGLPLALTGEEQPMTHAARAFAAELGRRSGLPVHLHDERMSSQEAARRFAAARAAGQRQRRDAALLDAIAAQVIVESYLAGGGLPPIPPPPG
jgi:putative Holliday junction resolvase